MKKWINKNNRSKKMRKYRTTKRNLEQMSDLSIITLAQLIEEEKERRGIKKKVSKWENTKKRNI